MSKSAYGVEFVGPFGNSNDYKVSVDGYVVPNILVHRGQPELGGGLVGPGFVDGMWRVTLSRHGASWLSSENIEENALKSALIITANAMACAAGYTCHGKNSGPMNPYACRISGLTADPDSDSFTSEDWTANG